jgi:hypothetical protein
MISSYKPTESITGSLIQEEESANFPHPTIPNSPSRKYLHPSKHLTLIYSNHFTSLRISRNSPAPYITDFKLLRNSSRLSTAATESSENAISKLIERNSRYITKIRTSVTT